MKIDMIDFHKQYPSPASFRRPDGSARFAFMTFVMRNDSFVPGALVFAHALRQQRTQADLVCMVTKDVTAAARSALEMLFDCVVEVDEIFIPHKRRQERQDRPFLFTRFQALRTGADGGLGLCYEKIVLADADVLPLRCYDHLFTLEAPAGILNEDKSLCMEYDADGKYILPDSVAEDGTWKWHRLYESICPHGTKIPREITDRVLNDPANMGVNSSLWVLRPSLAEYENLLAEANRPEVNERIGNTFDWPEMQFATLHWSGQWTSIDLRFSSFNGYPQLDVLCGTHFAGYKPWKFKGRGTILRFSRFPDYALWHRSYLEMLGEHPGLQKVPRLKRLESEIRALAK
jgi:glycogenin glucosyltransferase